MRCADRSITDSDLNALLTRVRDFWYELVITNYSDQISVTAPTYEGYLAELAKFGLDAWYVLFGSRAGGQQGASETIGALIATMNLPSTTLIQITYGRSTPGNFIFPWSIIYPPSDPAGKKIDPLQFWGARFQIEQVREGSANDALKDVPIGISFILDRAFKDSGAPDYDVRHAYVRQYKQQT